MLSDADRAYAATIFLFVLLPGPNELIFGVVAK